MRAYRNLYAWMLVAFALLLSGCAGQSLFTPVGTIPVDQTKPAQIQKAQTAINEANVLIASVANVIAEDVTEGIITKVQAQTALSSVREARNGVKTAEALLAAGNPSDAQAKAQVAQDLIVALQRQLAAQAKKGT